jgi:hypothetical protein
LRRFVFVCAGFFLAILIIKSAPLALFVFDTKAAQPGRLPDGWRVKVVRGTPEANVVPDPQGLVLHLKSRSSSYSLEKGVDIDPAQFPYLEWKWKVTDLPRGGDLRSTSTDDQAAQLIVAFSDRRILDYIWDTSAPKDMVQSVSVIPFVHVFAFVCRSGSAEANRWIPEVRNIADDYERVFGHRPTQHVKGIRVQINSQHTGTSAESYFGEIAFRSTR